MGKEIASSLVYYRSGLERMFTRFNSPCPTRTPTMSAQIFHQVRAVFIFFEVQSTHSTSYPENCGSNAYPQDNDHSHHHSPYLRSVSRYQYTKQNSKHVYNSMDNNRAPSRRIETSKHVAYCQTQRVDDHAVCEKHGACKGLLVQGPGTKEAERLTSDVLAE